MTIVGTNPEAVIGGVDTHAEVHVAAVVNHVGGVLGVESFTTTQKGYRQLVSWLASHGELTLVGVEGTGSYGVGVARYLARAGIDVVEVDRPNRQARHRKGKSDPVDAVAAARAALSGQASGLPKTRDGNVEAIRVLMIARRSAIDTRIETLNQLRHVIFTASPQIRAKFTGLTAIGLTNKAAALKPRHNDPDQVRHITLVTIRTLGRRVQYLREETKSINRLLRPLIRATAPGLLEVYGVGFNTAAKLLVAVGDNPQRIRSEAAFAHLCGVAPIPASSGKTVRHRLNRGGNRQANSALFHIVLTRMKHHQPTRDYVARRLKEGKTTGEIARILKRYVAREVFKHLPRTA
ncbi:MAG: IS110 family transposase [Acidimicrobiia bacterium]|nr:IS110 family transposase [Acidimicrobiia bacterium]